MSSAGQGSISLSQRTEITVIPPPVIPTLQQVTTAGNVTTVQSLFNGGIRATMAGAAFILGVTNNDFPTAFGAMMQVSHRGGQYGFAITRSTTDTGAASMNFFKTRGGGFASVAGALVDGDGIGGINFQGVSVNLTQTLTTARFSVNAVTTNGGAVFGAGAVPVGSVASYIDFLNTTIGGVFSNTLRIWPNGECCFVNLPSGAIIPRVNGMLFQAYGSGAFRDNLQVGAVANNNALAVLELTSTTKGFLPARMTAVQGTALAVGAAEDGLQIHVTTVNATFPTVGPYWWNNAGGVWVPM